MSTIHFLLPNLQAHNLFRSAFISLLLFDAGGIHIFDKCHIAFTLPRLFFLEIITIPLSPQPGKLQTEILPPHLFGNFNLHNGTVLVQYNASYTSLSPTVSTLYTVLNNQSCHMHQYVYGTKWETDLLW